MNESGSDKHAPTPRTDAATYAGWIKVDDGTDSPWHTDRQEWTKAEVARQLEHELAEERDGRLYYWREWNKAIAKIVALRALRSAPSAERSSVPPAVMQRARQIVNCWGQMECDPDADTDAYDALAFARAILASSSSASTREPGMAPGAELLVETDRNARYWLEGGRKEKKRDEAVLAIEQAVNAWRNAAYAMAARAIQEAERASASHAATPERQVIRPPFQKALTVVMTKDDGDKQADADLAAIKGDSGTVFRVGVSRLYFAHLRLRAALDPALLDKIAVFYLRPEDQVLQECGLRRDDELRWPVDFDLDLWQKETEIASVRHQRENLIPDSEPAKTVDRLRAKYTPIAASAKLTPHEERELIIKHLADPEAGGTKY